MTYGTRTVSFASPSSFGIIERVMQAAALVPRQGASDDQVGDLDQVPSSIRSGVTRKCP